MSTESEVARVLPGRLCEHEAYPAGHAGVVAEHVTIATGERVRVIVAGPAGGRPVVLLHGWGCGAYVWRRNVPALAAAGFRVYAPELRGHGFSSKPTGLAPYTLESLAAFVLAVLDALGLGRAVLVGHSMSGALVAHVATRHPERVAALGMLAPVGAGRIGWGPVRWIPAMRAATPAVTARMLPYVVGRWAIAGVLAMAYGGRNQFGSRDVREYWAPTQFPEFAEAMRALLHEFDWRPFASGTWAAMAMPLLVVFGTRDRFVDGSELEMVRRERPDATAEWIEGAGHILPEEVPDRLNAMLVSLAGGEQVAERSA